MGGERRSVRTGAECPYIDTVERTVLDFDFEKLCSVAGCPRPLIPAGHRIHRELLRLPGVREVLSRSPAGDWREP